MASKEVLFCRICLSVNLTKKYYLKDTLEREFIEQIFKSNGYFMDLNDRSYVCCECRISLHKSYKFTQKALKAQRLFYKYMLPLESLTQSTLASVDRELNGISTDLIYSATEIHDVKPFTTENNDSIKVKEDDDDINENVDPLVQDNSNVIDDVKVEKDPIGDIPNYNHLDAPCKEVVHSVGVFQNGLCDVKDQCTRNADNKLKCNENIRLKTGESTKAVEFLGEDGANVLDSHEGNEEKESNMYIDPYTGELGRMDPNSKEIKCNDYSDEVILLCDSSSDSDDHLKTVQTKNSLLNNFKIDSDKEIECAKKKRNNFVIEEIFEHDASNVIIDDVKVEKDPIGDIPNYLDAPCKEVVHSVGVFRNGVCDVKDQCTRNADNKLKCNENIRLKTGESTKAVEFLVEDGANVLDSHDGNEEKESNMYIDPYTGELVRMDPNSEEMTLNDYSDETIFLSDSSSDSDIDLKNVKINTSLLKELNDFEISDSFHLERPKRKKYNFVTEEIVEHDVNNVSADPDVSNIIEGRFRNKKRVSYKGLDKVNKNKETEKPEIEDEDFVPSASDVDESADDSCDGYNNRGKAIKSDKHKDKRTFPMTCEQCEAIICSKAEHACHYLLMHKDKEYPYANQKTNLCPYCGKYVANIRRAEHMLKHTADKPACHICNKKYSCRSHMLAHIRRVHEKHLCFTCDYCKKKFWSKEELKIHLRSHTGEKPFKCHLCDYRCAHKGNLRPHIQYFHQKMEITKKAVRKDKEKGSEKNKKSRAKNGEKKKRSRRKVVTSSNSE